MAGTGPVYQGRFKSFPIQTDHHLLVVFRYIERNPLRANLVRRAEDWRWSSLRRSLYRPPATPMLPCPWPIDRPADWPSRVNEPQTPEELAAIRRSLLSGHPLGDEQWVKSVAQQLGLAPTPRPRGRPRKEKLNAPS